ncbi:hypothetical protein, partial [Arthrobacter sp. AQ5-05]|uniref:hypothetical protein n=1 Tax=Arthrobacter sp. AQ5-05 TaxID=2184581 RepID=UPI001C65D4F1
PGNGVGKPAASGQNRLPPVVSSIAAGGQRGLPPTVTLELPLTDVDGDDHHGEQDDGSGQEQRAGDCPTTQATFFQAHGTALLGSLPKMATLPL